MIRDNKQTRIKLVDNKYLNTLLNKIQKGEALTEEEKKRVDLFYGL